MTPSINLAAGHRGNRTERGPTALEAAAHGGPWSEIQCLADTVFDTLTDQQAHQTDNDGMTGFTVPAGTVLFGYFTEVTLTSGAVRLYAGAYTPAA